MGDHPREAPVLARRVLVEDEDVAPRGGADHSVVVGAEASPVPLLDHADAGEVLANGGRRPVLGCVVEDDDLDASALKRLEARQEQLARVRIDQGNRDVGH